MRPDQRSGRYEIAFVVEDVLGHLTHGANLRAHVPDDPDVSAHWVEVPYPVTGPAAHLPVYRSNWTVRSGWRGRRGLNDVARRHPLDAVFFHTQVPAMLRPRWATRLPMVISVDATPLQYDRLGEYYGHQIGSGAIERLKFRAACTRFGEAAHIVTWSAWAKTSLVDDYAVPADKVTVIAPGVDVAAWRRPSGGLERSGRVRLLFVGGDLERKGGRLLVEAFRSLEELDVELHLVTRDDAAAESRIHVHRDLHPNSPELRELYGSCDLFVLPTYGDCLPMVLSEAGAAALPLVSTCVAAIPEIVVDGVTGLLVPPGDVSALAAALRQLVVRPDERRRMGSNAASHVARHYDTATNTARLLDVVKSAVDRSTAARVAS